MSDVHNCAMLGDAFLETLPKQQNAQDASVYTEDTKRRCQGRPSNQSLWQEVVHLSIYLSTYSK